MDGFEKLASLKDCMSFEADDRAQPASAPGQVDVDCPLAYSEEKTQKVSADLPIYRAALPNGQHTPILKTLLTSACEKNCYYCAFRAGHDFRRVTFKPEELAKTYLSLFQRGIARGMFLSSGVAGGGVRTQDRLLATAEVLRNKLDYRGYLHLKIMPGAERAQVERAMQLADRVSINLEAPNTERLARLAPQKTFIEELLTPLNWVEEIRTSQYPSRTWNRRWPSSTTQFVAGGCGESDAELLQASEYLHKSLKLARVYYSGFKPVAGTPLENQPAINPWRQNRLYQADFLLRDYGFEYEDFPFDSSGNLPLEVDPKLAWAYQNLQNTPVELNRADLQELLRVPGIGPRGARVIMAARRENQLQRLEDLKALGIRTNRVAPFVLIDGRQPAVQLRLF
jgi:predicted DNA-binding helix-hairpin-helix protein